MCALFKDGKIIATGTRKELREYADRQGFLMHFGNIDKGILAAGYTIEEVKE